MIEKHSITLTGASGASYTLIVSALSAQTETTGAVYVVSCCSEDDQGTSDYAHSPIFLGSTSNLATEFTSHPKAKCFQLAAKALKVTPDALAVASILEPDAKRRREIEADLKGLFKWICNSWKP